MVPGPDGTGAGGVGPGGAVQPVNAKAVNAEAMSGRLRVCLTMCLGTMSPLVERWTGAVGAWVALSVVSLTASCVVGWGRAG
ncbi:hypothetical protein Acsp05_40750 [Actinokineospora sp. NBRC 105648]|nr:hypothetical protein Acsp05_40750 [Actinokineospora sp. NBRC 105648]